MNYKKFLEYDNHELVVHGTDSETGLNSFIVIHSTILGPATGGTRFLVYESEEEALKDGLRLSRAMTYKCALAGVPFGGGKGIIIANPNEKKSKKLLTSYAKKVNNLNGLFTTGEDVGVNNEDIEYMQNISPFINGREGGDLSPWAAEGIFYAMQAALQHKLGKNNFKGVKVAIKGLGKIGLGVCKHINAEGGTIIGSDINREAVQKAKKLYPKMQIVPVEKIHKYPADILSLCALGGDLHKKSIKELQCSIICGGANNQLHSEEDSNYIHKRKILYIPDYVANAGGLINAVASFQPGGYNTSWVENKIKEIYTRTKQIIHQSENENISPYFIAKIIAEETLKKAKREKARQRTQSNYLNKFYELAS